MSNSATLWSLGLAVGLACGVAPTVPADTFPSPTTDICPEAPLTPPECTRPNFDLPFPGPAGSACASHGDCAVDEFCGAGSCRVANNEYVAFCVESALYQGPAPLTDGTPPRLTVEVGAPYSYIYEDPANIYIVSEATCAPAWNICELFYLDDTYVTGRTVITVKDINQEETASIYTFPLEHPDGGGTAALIGQMANLGCQKLTSPDGALTLWVSVWSKENDLP